MKVFRRSEAEQRRRPVTEKPAPNPSYTYYKSSASNTSEKTIDLRNERRFSRTPTIIALIVIGFSILFSLTLSTKPSVTTASGEASPFRSAEEYAVEADKILSQNMNNRSKLTIQTALVEEKLLAAFPELSAVDLRLPVIGRRMTMLITVRQPVVLLVTPARSYVVDVDGRVVSDVKEVPQEARTGLIVVQDQSGLDLSPGDQALTSDTVAFMSEVKRQLSNKSLEVSELTLPTTPNQLDIRLKDTPYYIKTDTAGDIRLQIGSFLAVRDQLQEQGITPAEYIDVRVEEKVFYK